MITPTVTVEAKLPTDFAFQDGTLVNFQDGTEMLVNGGAWADISDDVSNRPITCTRGIPSNTVLDRIAKDGTLTMYMNNSASNSAGLIGYYSLEHTNTRLGWNIDLQIRIKFAHTSYDSGTAHVRFSGRITNIAPVPGQYRSRIVKVTVKDYMNILSEYDQMAQVSLLQDSTTADAYQTVIDTLSIQPEATSYATGLDTLDFIFHRSGERSGSAFEEFNRLALSSLDYLYIAADGTLTTQNRESRINSTSLFTLSSDLSDFTPDDEKYRVVDRVVSVVYPTEVGTSAETIYESNPYIKLGPGERYSATLNYTDPNSSQSIGINGSTSSTYRFGSTKDATDNTLSGDLTKAVTFNAASANAVFTNNGTKTGYINYIKLQAIILRTFDPIEAEKQIVSGRSSTITINMPYQSDPSVGVAATEFVANTYGANSKQYGAVKYSANRNITTFANFMDADIGSAFSITETVTGVSAQKLFIQNENWTLMPGRILDVSYGTIRARSDNPFIVGTSKVNSTAVIMFSET